MSLLLSANLGFLWTDRPLPDAIRTAYEHGFDAVELHWPYDIDPALIRAALDETGLPVIGINTSRGDVDAGDYGLSALPHRIDEARKAIDDAIAYANAIGASAVHVMAGKTDAPEARATFVANLQYAADHAAGFGLKILIEPLNRHDAPGYFLTDSKTASSLIAEVDRANLGIMLDCYHVARAGREIVPEFVANKHNVVHVQFANVPDRHEPVGGDVDFSQILPELVSLGYEGLFGVEYRPRASTDEGLGWLADWRKRGINSDARTRAGGAAAEHKS